MSDKKMIAKAIESLKEFVPTHERLIPNVSFFQRKLGISYVSAMRIHEKLYPKKITNGDRIRAMSNEEMAELFIGDNDNRLFCTLPGARFVANFDEEEKLKAWIVEYLESEVEND